VWGRPAFKLVEPVFVDAAGHGPTLAHPMGLGLVRIYNDLDPPLYRQRL